MNLTFLGYCALRFLTLLPSFLSLPFHTGYFIFFGRKLCVYNFIKDK